MEPGEMEERPEELLAPSQRMAIKAYFDSYIDLQEFSLKVMY